MKDLIKHAPIAAGIAAALIGGGTLTAISQNNNTGQGECISEVRGLLKDPSSFRFIKYEFSTLTYSATNSFGGRVQDRRICTPSVKAQAIPISADLQRKIEAGRQRRAANPERMDRLRRIASNANDF